MPGPLQLQDPNTCGSPREEPGKEPAARRCPRGGLAHTVAAHDTRAPAARALPQPTDTRPARADARSAGLGRH